VAAVLVAPSWAAAATVGEPLNVEQFRVCSFLLPVCGGAAMFLARRRGAVNVGAYLWWVFLCLPAGMLRLSVGFPIALALSALACGLGMRGIRQRRGHP